MPNLVAPSQAAIGMRQYAASSDGVLASLLAHATQQLGDAILWLGTLVGCVALLLLLLHAVGTTTARTCLGPNRFAGTATAGAAMLSKIVLLSSGASRVTPVCAHALSGCVPCHRSCVGERCLWRLLRWNCMHSPPRVCRLQHD